MVTRKTNNTDRRKQNNNRSSGGGVVVAVFVVAAHGQEMSQCFSIPLTPEHTAAACSPYGVAPSPRAFARADLLALGCWH